MNLCVACGLDFASVEAFDLHRIGTHDYSVDEGLLFDPPREDGRRCLSIEELTSRGWALDKRRRWVHPREIRKRLRRGGDSVPSPTSADRRSLRSSTETTRLSKAITAARGHDRKPQSPVTDDMAEKPSAA